MPFSAASRPHSLARRRSATLADPSLFGAAVGMIYCVPHLLFGEDAGLINRGFRASVCTHASSYGMGEVGFFVALFIYSKLVEARSKAAPPAYASPDRPPG